MTELEEGAVRQHEQRSLPECLELFNRKERYWLIRNVLGNPADREDALPLSSHFRRRLGEKLNITIPCDAWWAIDYHIDWLFGALTLDRLGDATDTCLQNPVSSKASEAAPERLIRGTQEDFDLILAFDRTIILIEAKGVTSWGNKQLASKRRRLADWHELSEQVAPDTQGLKQIEMFIVLTSPQRPKLARLEWPSFVRLDKGVPFFVELALDSAPAQFYAPQRCTEDRSTSATGEHWKLEPSPRPNLVETEDQRAAVVALNVPDAGSLTPLTNQMIVQRHRTNCKT